METTDRRNSRALVIWLFSGCFLVFAMVVIGGITRLTGSGLSITEWNVIMGSVPPLNENDWQIVFGKYKDSPQFQKQNFFYELSDFKRIFWWEYIHRLTGRIIGLVFIIPFAWFLIKKQIDKNLLPWLLLIFALGGFQGFLGWYMVKSGLVNNPSVSHYRLATHLIAAFATFGLIFRTAIGLVLTYPGSSFTLYKKIRKLSNGFFFLVIIQIIYGAFVAGLKAGLVYNTFPKMGDEWMASSVAIAFVNNGWRSLTENPASIQFIHRSLAWALVIYFCVIGYFVFKSEEKKMLTKQQTDALKLVGITLVFQFLLGMFTLIYSVPVVMGVLHQSGAFLLFAAVLYLLHVFRLTPDDTGRVIS